MQTQNQQNPSERPDVKMEQARESELTMEKPKLVMQAPKTNQPMKVESNQKSIKRQLKEDLGYDSDLVIDEEDEQKLDAMTELQREQEIQERKQRRDILMQRYELVKKQHEVAKRASDKKQSSKEDGQLSDQSMDSSDDSSSSSSSSDSSEASVSKRENKKKKAKEE